MNAILESKNTHCNYNALGAKEQENYNYAKTVAVLAEHDFQCFQIKADKHGGDMIAYHTPTAMCYVIQLKGSRATLARKYQGKNIWIAYIDRKTNELCLYDHDRAVEIFEKTDSAKSESWFKNGHYSGQTMHRHFNEIIIRKSLS